MPGTRCAVATCTNSLVKTRKSDPFISYHSFPKNSKFRKLWIAACSRRDSWNPNTSHICSKHFAQEDFETPLIKCQLLREKCLRRLKPYAVPIYHIEDPLCNIFLKSSNFDEANISHVQSLVKDIKKRESRIEVEYEDCEEKLEEEKKLELRNIQIVNSAENNSKKEMKLGEFRKIL